MNIYQNTNLIFNSLDEYLYFSVEGYDQRYIGMDAAIPYRRRRRNYPQMPDPEKYRLDDEFYNQLDLFLQSINYEKYDSRKGIDLMLTYLNTNFKHTYLECLIKIFCLYLTGQIKAAAELCLKVFEMYMKNLISYDEYLFIAQLFGYFCYQSRVTVKSYSKIHFILSPVNSDYNEINEFENVFQNTKNNFNELEISASRAYKYKNFKELASELKNEKYDLIAILAHGNPINGLILDFSGERDRIEVDKSILLHLKKHLFSPDNPFLLFGCNTLRYREQGYDFINRISTSTGWSAPEAQHFIYGFLHSIKEGNGLQTHYNNGRISLMLRAHSMAYVHLDWRAEEN